ncbi:FecR domain-containing protein [Sphingobium sp. H39-3-25]|uniref:FecR family protein n=1 Tax=Sphingobium arseniciresistens TaxID=3030834 RepID=UPI0023B925E2|nr:FecR domain-containing protein [Sphingobium arseniciresistens]
MQKSSDVSSRRQIEEEAARLLVRLSLDASDEEREAACRWIEADPRHAVAFARAEAAWEYAERLKARPIEDVAPQPAKSGKPKFPLAIAGLVAVSLVTIGGIVGMQKLHDVERYRTNVGEVSHVRLADGSVMHLGSNSAVEVRLSPSIRTVRLLSGDVSFDVAHDKARPFDVSVNDSVIRAVGTAFNLRLKPALVELAVTEGTVDVRSGARPVEHVSAGNGAAIRARGFARTKISDSGHHAHSASSGCKR